MDRPSDSVDPVDPEEPLDPAETDARFGSDLCRELLRSQVGERYLGRTSAAELRALEAANRADVVSWLRRRRRPRTPFATIKAAKTGTVAELADRIYGDESERPTWREHLNRALTVAADVLGENIDRGSWKLEQRKRRRRPGSRESSVESGGAALSAGTSDRPFGGQLKLALKGSAQGKAILERLSRKAVRRLDRADRRELSERYAASLKPSQPLLEAFRERSPGEVAELLVEQQQMQQTLRPLGWI